MLLGCGECVVVQWRAMRGGGDIGGEGVRRGFAHTRGLGGVVVPGRGVACLLRVWWWSNGVDALDIECR